MEENKKAAVEMAFQQIKLPTNLYIEDTYSNRPYVKYGVDNNFPELLIQLADRSALHNAIISSKVDYCYASGLTLKDNDLASKLFVNHPNPYESLNEIYRKCLYDYIMYGAFAVNVIWSNDGESIAEIYHIDASKIRSGKKNGRGFVEEYFYSDDWSKSVPRYKSVKAFDITDRTGGQLLYCKSYRPGTYYYPLPDYSGSLNYIATDAEISNYHLSHILNGMAPSYLITFCNGIPEEAERKKIKRQFESEYCGSDNAGKFVLSYIDDPDKAPKIESLSADNLAEQFIQLQDTVVQNILAGHRIVSPSLVGIKSEGISFGSGEEIKNAFYLFNNNVIKPIQDFVVGQFNRILKETNNWIADELIPTEINTDFVGTTEINNQENE